MIRRSIFLVMILTTALAIAACGGNSVETPGASTQPAGDDAATQPTDSSGTTGSNNGQTGSEGETDDDDNSEQEFDPFPFGTPVPEESDDDRILLEPTLAALGAPVQPTLEATLPPFGGIEITPGELGSPGEVSYAEATEPVIADDSDGVLDPTVDPATLLFDQVTVIRAGGPGGNELTIDIYQDGTVLMNGQQVTVVTPQNIIDLDILLDEIRIFEMRGIFASTFPDRNDYQYVISVNRADGSISHRADDSLMPPELARVVQMVMDLAVGTAPGSSN